MMNTELLSAISVNSGVASNLARDCIRSMLLNGSVLSDDDRVRILEISTRIGAANCAAAELVERVYRRAAEKNTGKFWESEQFYLFK